MTPVPQEIHVDGSFFVFPDGWQVTKLDEWPEQKRLTRPPFGSKSCDLAAVSDGTLWLIEAKDYTYPGAKVPPDLAETVGVKIFHSLAIVHAVARWGVGSNREFSARALTCDEIRVCLAVELPDGGRGLIKLETPLAHLRQRLREALKPLGVRPVIANSRISTVPWTVRRDPDTRDRHADR